MQSKQQNTKVREKKIEGMRKIKEAYEAAKKAGTIKRYKIQIVYMEPDAIQSKSR